MYETNTLTYIATFESIRDTCKHLNLDYTKMRSVISNICNRKQKTLMGKFIFRYASDDEFSKN